MKEKKTNYGKIVWITLLSVLVILLLWSAFAGNGSYGEKITITEFQQKIENGEFTDVYYYNGIFRARIKNSEIEDGKFPSYSDFYCEIAVQKDYEDIKNAINEANETTITIKYNAEPTRESLLSSIMPYLSMAIILIIGYFLLRAILKGNAGTMSFGRSRARSNDNIKVRFSDVAGADEEKAELQEVVEFLKNPQKFTDLGARIPKGVLLVGPPGTGKTLLAKAVAGESNVPFLSISGSDFVEMFVGVGASRVRDLFEQAKKARPCIIFIDEIDAVGRQRGTGLGGGNDEREQTLNQLLVEMDGFEANEGIIVLAATNRSDVLDPALLRPGRFDRQIYVHVPDVRGREAIIKIHARNKPIDDEVDYQTLARITSGFTGADIENMLNEASILAARADRPKIIMSDLTEGINKVIMGPQKKSLLVTERDKKITTYHEAGHAILGKILPNCDEVQEVSIIPRGMAAGYTMSRPNEDDNHVTYNRLLDQIAMCMGGRIAEELVFGDISTGAQNDIKQASEIARKMVTEWGMSKELGFVGYDTATEPFLGRDYQNQSKYSEKTAAIIDSEIRGILKGCYDKATKILKENRILMDRMSEILILKETIYKEEVDMIMAGKSVEEIVSEMDKKAQLRKIKEEKGKEDLQLAKKIKQLDEKIKTAEMLVKAGVVTKEEFEQLKKSRDELNKKIESSAASKEEQKEKNKEDVVKEEKKTNSKAKSTKKAGEASKNTKKSLSEKTKDVKAEDSKTKKKQETKKNVESEKENKEESTAKKVIRKMKGEASEENANKNENNNN